MLNGASYSGNLAPGTWAAVFGTGLAPSTTVAASVPLPTSLAGVSVTFGGVSAPLYFVSAAQINVVIPFGIAIPTSTTATVPVIVSTPAGNSAAFAIQLVPDAPAIFTSSGTGTGAPLAFNASFQPVTTTGSGTIVMYAAGLGATNPPASSSAGGATSPPFNTVTDNLGVYIGDSPATIGFAGLAPGFPGIYQLNVTPNGPLSDRIYLQSGGVQSNITTLPTAGGGNVANVTGSIDGLYPSAATTAGFSLLFTGAAFDAAFDILPNAKPFSVLATTDAGTAVINIDPVHSTWNATALVPTALARQFNFSNVSFPIHDFAACPLTCYLPGNIEPASRIDPVLDSVLQAIPLPNAAGSPGNAANGTWSASGTFTGTHFSVSSAVGSGSPVNFGGFTQITHFGLNPRPTSFNLYVDGVLVASKSVNYTVQ